MTGRRQTAFVIAACFLAGILGAFVGHYAMSFVANDQAAQSQDIKESRGYTIQTAGFDESAGPLAISGYSALTKDKSENPVVQAVQKVGPAVVNIDTVAMKRQSIFDFGPDFGGLFEDDMFSRTVPSHGQGSGLIIDSKNGYIVTNDHVVHDAVVQKGEIKVSLADKRSFDARIVGLDPLLDLAVLQIDAKNLPQAQLGSSDQLVIGEWVIAIGNPFGLRNTVTVGVVSATGRSISTENGKLEGLVQTDAAINPGNSGGPLCDVTGKVVGINTAIFRGADGMGFAIGASSLAPAVEELITYGRIRRGWSGMNFLDITGRIAWRLGLESTEGVLIARIFRGGPAHEAGIKPGDVILEIDGKTMQSAEEVEDILRKSKEGQTIELRMQRENKKFDITLKLDKYPRIY